MPRIEQVQKREPAKSQPDKMLSLNRVQLRKNRTQSPILGCVLTDYRIDSSVNQNIYEIPVFYIEH